MSRPIIRTTYTDRVVGQMRADIIAGVLPPGERLLTSEGTRRYGISATPFREAVQRLAAEGLIQLDPQLGPRVSPISITDLRDIYDARLAIEPMVTRRALALGSKDYRSNVRQAMQELGAIPDVAGKGEDAGDHYHAWSLAHRRFHWTVVSGCQSKYLLQIMRLLYDHSERYQVVALGVPGRRPVIEHRAICAAILRADVEATVEAVRHHLVTTVDTLASRHADLG